MDEPKFKRGDMIKCINAEYVSNITEGKLYRVRGYASNWGSRLVIIVNDKGEEYAYMQERFISNVSVKKLDYSSITREIIGR